MVDTLSSAKRLTDSVTATVSVTETLSDGSPVEITLAICRLRPSSVTSADAGKLQAEAAAEGLVAAWPEIEKVLEGRLQSTPATKTSTQTTPSKPVVASSNSTAATQKAASTPQPSVSSSTTTSTQTTPGSELERLVQEPYKNKPGPGRWGFADKLPKDIFENLVRGPITQGGFVFKLSDDRKFVSRWPTKSETPKR